MIRQVNVRHAKVVATQQAVQKRRQEGEERGEDLDETPNFRVDQPGYSQLKKWAGLANTVMEAGDEIEAMNLDDVEYHVSISLSL